MRKKNYEFQKNIRKLREKNNLSRKEFGKMLGAAERTVNNWEKGIYQPNKLTLKRILETFDVSLTDLYGGEPHELVEEKPRISTTKDLFNIEEVPEVKNRYYQLIMPDDSLAPQICKGDRVTVRKQVLFDDNDLVVIRIGKKITIRKIANAKGGIVLFGLSEEHTPRFFSDRQVKAIPIKVYGKALEVCNKL